MVRDYKKKSTKCSDGDLNPIDPNPKGAIGASAGLIEKNRPGLEVLHPFYYRGLCLNSFCPLDWISLEVNPLSYSSNRFSNAKYVTAYRFYHRHYNDSGQKQFQSKKKKFKNFRRIYLIYFIYIYIRYALGDNVKPEPHDVAPLPLYIEYKYGKISDINTANTNISITVLSIFMILFSPRCYVVKTRKSCH